MTRIIASSLVLFACTGTALLMQDAEPQPAPAAKDVETDSVVDKVLERNDTDKDGEITWKEVVDLHESRATAIAEAGASKDAKKALEEVKEAYASLMPRMEFLLADADRNLEVTSAELRDFLVLSATEGTPKPELWHHEHLARDWVRGRWEQIIETVAWDNKDSIAKWNFVVAATWEPSDDDWNLNKDFDDGIERPKEELPDKDGWRRPTPRLFNLEIDIVDKDQDGRLNQEEFAMFKARERMRGWWVDELTDTVEVRDAHGVLLASSANARVPDDYVPLNDEGMKLGSSWTIRHYTPDEPNDSYDVRHQVTYLNAQWSSNAEQEDRMALPAQRRVHFEDGRFWLRMNVFQAVRRKLTEDGRQGERVRHDVNPRFAPDARTLLEEITVPAGTFKCTLRGWTPDQPGVDTWYQMSVGGVPIDVMRTDGDGNRKLELISFDK